MYAEVADVSPDFFATLGLPIVAGRPFDSRDTRNAPRVAIVNETLARVLVGESSAAGKMMGMDGGKMDTLIVGVVRDARHRSLKSEPGPALYRPLAQTGGYGEINVLLRTAVPDAISITSVREVVRRLDPAVAVTRCGGLAALARETLLRERMLAGLSLVFAALSATLAGMGLFGVASFNVTRRTREVGIRLALGASRVRVERMILRESAWLILTGAGLGIGLFLATNRVLQSMLFQVSPNEPVTIGAAAVTLTALALLAAWLPARRAANLDPAVTLRRD